MFIEYGRPNEPKPQRGDMRVALDVEYGLRTTQPLARE